MGQGRPLTRRQALGRAAVTAATAGAAFVLPGCERRKNEVDGRFIGISMERGHLLRDPKGLAPVSATHRAQVAIVGAGVAGLAAMRALSAGGVDDFVLFDLEDVPGGNARGAVVGGLPCPMGAHYLPVPGDDAHEVQDLLEAFGLRQRLAGRWVYDERFLCHSPQERLFFQGGWQEGLLPWQDVAPATLEQYRRFSRRATQIGAESKFTIPAFRAPMTSAQARLAAMPFAQWLRQEGFDDPHLLWYLDYCCRDDYGAGILRVSAWAGLHYFDSRHGFAAPGEAGPPDGGLLTWPEGNGWLTQRLAAPAQSRTRTAHTVLRIAEQRAGVELDAFNHRTGHLERYVVDRVVVALPAFVAARIVESAPDFLRENQGQPHASWVVANIHIREPLDDRPGAPPSWDNVIYGAAGLGYVDARHQSLDPRPSATVLTWYRALGDSRDARMKLAQQDWSVWRDEAFAELAAAHPDLPEKASRFEVTRYGHAMAIPVPQQRGAHRPPVLMAGRLAFAHADWSDYSIFEEAFIRGHLAGEAILAAAGRPRARTASATSKV